MHVARILLLLLSLVSTTSALAQDRVIVSVKHVLGGILGTRSIGLFTFDFEIREAFRQMNNLLEREGLPWRLELDEIVDVSGISQYFDLSTDDVGAFEDDALSDPDKYLWRDDAINIYLVNAIDGAGGVCSFPHDSRHEDIIVIANGLFDGIANASGGWLHEIGHYLSLLHTFEGSEPGDCTGARQTCPDTCPDDDNIMSYNDLFVFFNLPGDFTTCQKRNMNFELYDEDGARGHVLVACEDACEEHRVTCRAECRGTRDFCRGTCDFAKSACYVPCDLTAGTCDAGCFVGLGACDVGCEVFCFFAPNSQACRDCRSACQTARSDCEGACDATRRGCKAVCDTVSDGCRGLCDSAAVDCDGECDQDAIFCGGDCPERPIGPPGMALPVFRRGDVNADRDIDISDGAFVLEFLFDSGPPPPCMDAADIDDGGTVELTDAIRLFRYLFLGGAEPVAPGARACGTDPSGDDLLGCASVPEC